MEVCDACFRLGEVNLDDYLNTCESCYEGMFCERHLIKCTDCGHRLCIDCDHTEFLQEKQGDFKVEDGHGLCGACYSDRIKTPCVVCNKETNNSVGEINVCSSCYDGLSIQEKQKISGRMDD